MNAPELCPAHRHDREEDPEERVICLREEHIPRAWTLICRDCWRAMLDGASRRQEWEVD
jgi:hypothetical protein